MHMRLLQTTTTDDDDNRCQRPLPVWPASNKHIRSQYQMVTDYEG